MTYQFGRIIELLLKERMKFVLCICSVVELIADLVKPKNFLNFAPLENQYVWASSIPVILKREK